MANERIVSTVINETLEKWAVEFIRQRQQDSKKIPSLTGEGHGSFDSRVRKAGGGDVALAIFEFADHMRLQDMRRVKWSRVGNIDALRKFVEKVGPNKFAGKFRAKYGYLPKNERTLINKLAWGIGISFKVRGSWKKKRVRWYNKQKWQGISSLYGTLLNNLSKESLDQMKRELKNRL